MDPWQVIARSSGGRKLPLPWFGESKSPREINRERQSCEASPDVTGCHKELRSEAFASIIFILFIPLLSLAPQPQFSCAPRRNSSIQQKQPWFQFGCSEVSSFVPGRECHLDGLVNGLNDALWLASALGRGMCDGQGGGGAGNLGSELLGARG